MHVHRTRFVLDRFNTSFCCKTSHDKLYNWHADSSRRSIVHLSRERTMPRDLGPNLSQILHLVYFISKLIIFIYKQLKRPVAFSVVHSLYWDEWCFHVKNRRVSCRLVIHLGMTCLTTVACVIPSRTKRLLRVMWRFKYAAVILCRRLVLMTLLLLSWAMFFTTCEG